jgi:hypothetical protein
VSAWALLTVALLELHGPQGAPAPATPPGGFTPTVEVSVTISALFDVVPRQDAAELRTRASLEITARPSERVRLFLDAEAQGLAADRHGSRTGAALHLREGWIEATGRRADVRAGVGRIVWGRLDEVQPTDVVNPLDAARFLVDGRRDARLSIAFVRGRVFLTDDLRIEGILAPVFRRGMFDALDEETSPFTLTADAALPPGVFVPTRRVTHVEPKTTWSNVSGGGRVEATIGRVDVAASVYRGFDGLGPTTLELEPFDPMRPALVGRLVQHHPRFTMVGGDFETVVGAWSLRGEVATFVEKTLLQPVQPGLVDGRSFDAGLGVDRRAGEYRLFTSAIVHKEWAKSDPSVERTDTNLVGSIERRFGRDHYLARTFAVVNPADASAFVRGLFAWSVRDNVSIDASAGVFLGTGDDTISRFKGRDFAFARLTVYF